MLFKQLIEEKIKEILSENKFEYHDDDEKAHDAIKNHLKGRNSDYTIRYHTYPGMRDEIHHHEDGKTYVKHVDEDGNISHSVSYDRKHYAPKIIAHGSIDADKPQKYTVTNHRTGRSVEYKIK